VPTLRAVELARSWLSPEPEQAGRTSSICWRSSRRTRQRRPLRRLSAARLAASWDSWSVLARWHGVHMDWSGPSKSPPRPTARTWSAWVARAPHRTQVGFAFNWARDRCCHPLEA